MVNDRGFKKKKLLEEAGGYLLMPFQIGNVDFWSPKSQKLTPICESGLLSSSLSLHTPINSRQEPLLLERLERVGPVLLRKVRKSNLNGPLANHTKANCSSVMIACRLN